MNIFYFLLFSYLDYFDLGSSYQTQPIIGPPLWRRRLPPLPSLSLRWWPYQHFIATINPPLWAITAHPSTTRDSRNSRAPKISYSRARLLKWLHCIAIHVGQTSDNHCNDNFFCSFVSGARLEAGETAAQPPDVQERRIAQGELNGSLNFRPLYTWLYLYQKFF